MFDPMLNLSVPVKIVSPQKYAKERLTKSVVKFNDFQYKSNFLLDKENNKATFNETMKDDATGNVRKNVHTLYMDTQKNILSIAKSVRFILEGKFDMINVNMIINIYTFLRNQNNTIKNVSPRSNININV